MPGSPAERLQAWLDEIQLSARLGFPIYANPSELKDDLRSLLVEFRTERAAARRLIEYLRENYELQPANDPGWDLVGNLEEAAGLERSE